MEREGKGRNVNSAIAGVLGLGVFLSLAVGSTIGFAVAGLSYAGMVVMLVGPRKALATARRVRGRSETSEDGAPSGEEELTPDDAATETALDELADGDDGAEEPAAPVDAPAYPSQGRVLDGLASLGDHVIAAASPLAKAARRTASMLTRVRMQNPRDFIVSLPALTVRIANSVVSWLTPRRIAGTLLVLLLLPVLLADLLGRSARPLAVKARLRLSWRPQLALLQGMRSRLTLLPHRLPRRGTSDGLAEATPLEDAAAEEPDIAPDEDLANEVEVEPAPAEEAPAAVQRAA